MLWTKVIFKVNFLAEVMGVQVPGWIVKLNSTVYYTNIILVISLII